MLTRVTVRGMRAWLNRVEDLRDRLEDLGPPGQAAAQAVAAQARPPVRTGRLAASRTVTGGPDVTVLSWTAPHAGFVHYGTRYMAGQPFATDALDAATDTVTGIYADHIDT